MEKLTEYVDGKYIRIKGTKSLYPKNERDGAPLSNAIARLAAYEETGLEPEELAQAKKKGRLVVLPRLHGKKLLRDGLEFEPNHWNITLTAFAHNQPTKSGKRVGLFSICEAAEAALDAMGGENNA